tara:strand:+ start:222 stop:1811 length:1590 start_codon:yes stop_codon:yes gene_type:complete
MNKNVLGKEAREALVNGVSKVSKIVKSTLGPKGRNVVIRSTNDIAPIVTKDGVTVARAIKLENKLENVGAEIAIEAAQKAADKVGDGTTTSVVLTDAILKASMHYVNEGIAPINISRSLIEVQKDILNFIDDHKKIVQTPEELKHIATIASNNDPELGELISEAFEEVGINGIVNIEPSKNNLTYLEVKEGSQFNAGYAHRLFCNTSSGKSVKFKNSFVLITDKDIDSIRDIEHYIAYSMNLEKPLVIIAANFSPSSVGVALTGVKKGAQICFLKPPSFGEERTQLLEDISVITGGYYIQNDEDVMLTHYTPENVLGVCKEIIINEQETAIIHSDIVNNDKIMHAHELKNKLDNAPNLYEKQQLEKRLASIDGGIVNLFIGADTAVQALEKYHRAEDAVLSTKAARIYGIVIGGGYLFDYMADTYKRSSETLGEKIMSKALRAPLQTILENAGQSYEVVKSNIDFNNNMLYNINTYKLGNLYEEGVIDPVQVLKTSIQTAISVVSTVLLTNAIILTDGKDGFKPEQFTY